MNKRQKEILQNELNNEKNVIKKIKTVYERALVAIDKKIELLSANKMTQSKIYQKQYQQVLKKQIEAILAMMNSEQYDVIQEYLIECYEDAFIGTLYDLHGQGIPLMFPINQEEVVQAIQHDTKLKKPLYEALGYDVGQLKKTIASEISRGIASAMMYEEIARNIRRYGGVSMSKALTIARTEGHRITEQIASEISRGIASAMMYEEIARNIRRYGGVSMSKALTIARTEGHRITEQARDKARYKAKEAGADIVKQWDSTLDSRTRQTHKKLDGQIRELEEPFEVNGHKAMHPGGFGIAKEDINCRCVALQRARWALDEAELGILKKRAEFFGLDKTKDLDDFKEKYMKSIEKSEKSGTIQLNLQFFASKEKQFGKKIGKHAKDYGLDPSKEADREKMHEIIDDIIENHSEKRSGSWRGQEKEVDFYIKDEDVSKTIARKEAVHGEDKKKKLISTLKTKM